MAVQYAYRLSSAGMVDYGSPQDASLQDRYAAVLQYQSAWMKGGFPLHMQDPLRQSRFLTYSNGVFVYATDTSGSPVLKLHRPGSARTGLPELTFLCDVWSPLLGLGAISGARFTADLSEDLLIVTLVGDDTNEHQHHFFSISNDCYPHPLAASSVFHAPCSDRRFLSLLDPNKADYVEILSDLVAWGHCQYVQNGSRSTACMEVQVLNWKTGAFIWRYTCGQMLSYHLIDRHHIILTQQDGIRVFAFDPDCSAQEPPACAKSGVHVLHLRLPQFEAIAQVGHTTSLLHIPRSHASDRPLFRSDPSLSLLAVRIDYTAMRDGQKQPFPTRLIIFVSLSTIRSYLSVRKTGLRRPLVLSWGSWSRTGARIVTVENVENRDFSISLYGSRCGLTLHTSSITNVVLVDAHPAVTQCDRSTTRRTLITEDRTVDSSDSHIITTLGPYRDNRRSRREKTMIVDGRFPCRMTWSPVLFPAEYIPERTVLTDQEVIVVGSRDP